MTRAVKPVAALYVAMATRTKAVRHQKTASRDRGIFNGKKKEKKKRKK